MRRNTKWMINTMQMLTLQKWRKHSTQSNYPNQDQLQNKENNSLLGLRGEIESRVE